MGSTANRLAGGDRGVERLARLRLDRDHADRAVLAERGDDARDQAAAADRDDHRVGVGCVLLDLERERPGAGEDERVLVRVDERAAGLLGQLVRRA